ncbi:integrase core domain-containing protein [Geoalkalibacter halelectricus]|uniref:integrase core domain-containing protein n=1 Tax=Geoalkalibacter halelectricus TaxID=2847045 RepID=UPI0036F3EF8A
MERFFRTVRSQLLGTFAGQTLEELNLALETWIRQEYHRRPHSSTGQSPLQRFANHLELIRKPPLGWCASSWSPGAAMSIWPISTRRRFCGAASRSGARSTARPARHR